MAEQPRRATSTVLLRDRYSGMQISLTIRDGIVVGAVGSEPERYLGLNESFARRYARFGGKPPEVSHGS